MGSSFVSEPMRVRTPATSANLGPGFDALGLALALYDDVSARVTASGCEVRVTGEGAGELPSDDQHLVVQAMRAAFDVLGGQPPGLAVDCVNRIPQARGLGSSSAGIVAGIQLARALVVDGERRLDPAGALRLAAELEGHPDNVAPCLLGGFTIAWLEPAAPAAPNGASPSGPPSAPGASTTPDAAGVPGASGGAGAPLNGSAGAEDPVAAQGLAGTGEPVVGQGLAAIAGTGGVGGPAGTAGAGGARAVRLMPAPGVQPTLFVPRERGLTATARAALPPTVPHRDAARNAGRAALLVHALTADPALLLAATEDRLHQGYRAPGMPGTYALLTALRAAGVAAVVSGAGPTVLALSEPPEGFDPGMGWTVRRLAIDVSGARVDRGMLGHAERDTVAAGRKS